MAYYRKKEVEDIIKNKNQELISENINSFNPIEQCVMQLENEENLVGFFWISKDLKMESKLFFRLSHNLYTDDRYVIDLYEAQKEGMDVVNFIERKLNRELKEKMDEGKIKEIKEKINNYKRHGA